MHFLVERTVDGNAADKEEAAKGEAKRQEIAKTETRPVVPAIISEPERLSTLFLTRNTHAEEWAKAKEKMRVDSIQREIDNAESAARNRSEEDLRNKRLAELQKRADDDFCRQPAAKGDCKCRPPPGPTEHRTCRR